MLSVIIGFVCLGWYLFIILVCTIGYLQILRYNLFRPRRAASELLPHNAIPHITIIRPVKGLEPQLYACLASSFQQSYPADELTIRFCISTRTDPAYPILCKLVEDFPGFDAQVLVEDEDPVLRATEDKMGPNPKIRNMSRAYREAKGDLVWIIDCNVWVGKGVGGRLVDLLCGYDHDGSQRGKRYKFVHQLPLAVDVSEDGTAGAGEESLLLGSTEEVASTSTAAYSTADVQIQSHSQHPLQTNGTRLEEMFLSSSHAKFYTAINTVLVAPCIVGKSNMFRRSHLHYLTTQRIAAQPHGSEYLLPGIDYFSHNICEDHLIGDLLWKNPVREEVEDGETLGKHALLYGDPVIQPAAHMRVHEYLSRRVRWLRVRKFTVYIATAVEPGTESFLCSAYGAFALVNVPWFHHALGLPQGSWAVAVAFWLLSISCWCAVDRTLYLMLHSMSSVEIDADTPAFASGTTRRPFREWLVSWLAREALAFPIWAWAVFGGVTVTWRGQRFRVGMDARVRAVGQEASLHTKANGVPNGKARFE